MIFENKIKLNYQKGATSLLVIIFQGSVFSQFNITILSLYQDVVCVFGCCCDSCPYIPIEVYTPW